jgi:hypothetical protein
MRNKRDDYTGKAERTNGHLIVDFPSTAVETPCYVSFADFTQVHFIENYAITHDKQSLWYTVFELQSLIDERDQNVRMLQRLSGAGKNDQTMIKYAQLRMHRANTTPIGLEDKVQNDMQKESINRRENHTKAVLVEQWRGNGDTSVRVQDSIANVSRKESEWARERAHVIGKIQAYDDCMSILNAIKELNAGATSTRTNTHVEPLNSCMKSLVPIRSNVPDYFVEVVDEQQSQRRKW